MLDGTPLLDIKPFVPGSMLPRVRYGQGGLRQASKAREARADKRFSKTDGRLRCRSLFRLDRWKKRFPTSRSEIFGHAKGPF